MAFIAALAIANPVCCCYAAGSDDSGSSSKTSSCCCSSSDQQDGDEPSPEHHCACKDKLKTNELKHVEMQVQESHSVALVCNDFSKWQAIIAPLHLPNQRVYQDRSPPPPLNWTLLYSVFKI
jgi:hypothetical protein